MAAPGTLDSLTDNVADLEAGAHVVAAGFLGGAPALALGDGRVLVGEGEDVRDIPAHPDATILIAAADGDRIVTGGDDGRVVAIDKSGKPATLADEKGRWIDALALGSGGVTAWAAGKQVRARDAKGKVKDWTAPSTVRGLVFAPKGYRLMAAHYNGGSLWFPNTDTAPEQLEWKGSHIDATWAPDGRFVVTSMQENQLHGWSLPAKRHMRMAGYPAKTRSMSWSSDGLWLATSGADAAIIWPFQGETGPMGKAPRECGVRPARVSAVAFHPKALVLAVGYEDGCVLLCRLTDGAELLVRRADRWHGRVSALAWDKTGKRLVLGTEGGAAGVMTLPV